MRLHDEKTKYNNMLLYSQEKLLTWEKMFFRFLNIWKKQCSCI